jgi:toxin-antitoxin system PIN domain toxin
MSRPSLPDINVWLALSLEAHPHHARAMEWFDTATADTVHFCRYTQQGTLRLLTTPAVYAPIGLQPMSNREAVKAMERMLADERITFAEEPLGLFEAWMRYADARGPSPKRWMDAYLAALALAGGYRLITTDKGIQQFKEVDVLVLK